MLIAVTMMTATPRPDEERGDREQPGDDDDRRQGVRRRPVSMRDLLEPARARDAVIAAEGEEHPAGGRDRRQAAEPHRDGDAGRQDAADRRPEVVDEDVDDGRAVAEVVLARQAERVRQRVREQRRQVRQVGREREQEDEPDDRADRDRQEDPPRAGDPRSDRLLGDVGGGVVPGVRPVGLEQREEEREDQRVGDGRAVLEVDEPEVVVPAASDVLGLDGEQGQARLVGLARAGTRARRPPRRCRCATTR